MKSIPIKMWAAGLVVLIWLGLALANLTPVAAFVDVLKEILVCLGAVGVISHVNAPSAPTDTTTQKDDTLPQ